MKEWSREVALLNDVVMEVLTEKVAFVQRPEGDMKALQVEF